jgi:hypothetical protein
MKCIEPDEIPDFIIKGSNIFAPLFVIFTFTTSLTVKIN